jgi:2-dehydropantoate 2-reductase
MTPSTWLMMMAEHFRILSFGAGAIGVYIGGSLALRGHQIVFLERPQTAQEIRHHGIWLENEAGKHRLSQTLIVESLEEALEQGPFDLALFALKSFDTKTAADQIAPYAAALPPVLCLQNGVDNEGVLGQVLGDDRVIAGTVTSAIGRADAGRITVQRQRGVGVADGHPLSAPLVNALNDAGLNARLYASAMSMKWSKLLTNLVANASSAILDMTPAEVFAHPDLYRLEIAQLRETLAVLAAADIPVTDLPGTPVKALAFAARLPARLSKPLLERGVSGGRGAKMPSFHIDLHQGRGKSEVAYLNGAVVRMGQKQGIHTPANDTLNETLLALTRGAVPLERYRRRPEALLVEYRARLAHSSITS